MILYFINIQIHKYKTLLLINIYFIQFYLINSFIISLPNKRINPSSFPYTNKDELLLIFKKLFVLEISSLYNTFY